MHFAMSVIERRHTQPHYQLDAYQLDKILHREARTARITKAQGVVVSAYLAPFVPEAEAPKRIGGTIRNKVYPGSRSTNTHCARSHSLVPVAKPQRRRLPPLL